MTINIDRLETALGHIRLNPEKHNQTTWACGTARCLGGWVVDQSDEYELVTGSDNWLVASGGVAALDLATGSEEFCGVAAANLLGFEYSNDSYWSATFARRSGNPSVMFNAANTLEDLELIGKNLANTGKPLGVNDKLSWELA